MFKEIETNEKFDTLESAERYCEHVSSYSSDMHKAVYREGFYYVVILKEA